ncbi:hypothetical protein [Lysobacter sp. CA199]|uniref:hypothetical protein n=1 Tax=Lysobacter sp. CA199 TaxID=3455608 RepID=UPI003F8D8B48
MKNTKRNRSRQAASPSKHDANLRDRLEKKLLKLCADIGWICGWRKERLPVVPVARRSSRRRVMLGRSVTAIEAQTGDAFGSVETKFVSTNRSVHRQTERSDPAFGLNDLVLDVHDEVAYQLSNAVDVAQLLSDPRVRAFGQQLAQKKVARA